jgi:hypothetical protein
MCVPEFACVPVLLNKERTIPLQVVLFNPQCRNEQKVGKMLLNIYNVEKYILPIQNLQNAILHKRLRTLDC